eukprot:TRINITY_DN73200_c0_g1_i1.p1 TRINITY_DN73200_c0_g1~~TRINITY_DN73200_c0_g1_i1.p1  ORF type:complete len:457 (-),score=40.10 TRINITY_DN73200_c0_g1_i1:41-1411(-)
MSLQWHYISLQGQEYGPFSSAEMRAWFDQGHFSPVSDDLLVRLPHWPTHSRLSEIYRGDRAAYFIAPPGGHGYHDSYGHPHPGYAPHHPWGAPPAYPPHAYPPPVGYPGGHHPPMPGYAQPSYGPLTSYGAPAYRHQRRSRSPSRSRSPRRAAEPKKTPQEEADEIMKQLGRDEVCRVLTGAVESLYEDRIRPLSLYVRGRLKEKGCEEAMLRCYLQLVPSFPSVFRLLNENSGNQQDAMIELIEKPSWFKGWIDIDDPDDKYEQSMWQDLEEYLKTGHEFAGGRYGMARELHARKLSFLSEFCLGEVCHIVQLAIQVRKLAVYHKKMLKTLDQAKAGGGKTGTGRTNSDFKNIESVPELCKIMFRLHIRQGKTPIRLEQLRNMMQREFGVTVSEMDFQCTKLSEVMKLEPIMSSFVSRNDNGSIRLSLVESSQLSEEARALYADAAAMEKKQSRP